jgi:hypothetical protein
MNERHFRLDEAELAEQAGQIEAERVIDSAELLMACEQARSLVWPARIVSNRQALPGLCR